MPEPWSTFIAVALSYLLGAVPWALLLDRMAGVDLRMVGSCNIGVGFAGFIGWGMLGPAALVPGRPAVVVGAALTLSVLILVRWMQDNPDSPVDLPSRLRRAVWDTDRVVVEDHSGGERAPS